jgi:hypothetical protein
LVNALTKAPVTEASTNWIVPSNAEALPATCPCGAIARAVVFGRTNPWHAM